MRTLLDLKREGKIRAIGVSNARVEQIEAYQRVGPVDSGQEKYSMLDRELENEYLPYTRKHNIAVLAYSPLANGLLTGKIGLDRKFPEDDLRHSRPRFSVESRRRVLAMLDKMQPIAEKHSLTLAQLVIASTIAQPGVTHALVGARNSRQAEENAVAGNAQPDCVHPGDRRTEVNRLSPASRFLDWPGFCTPQEAHGPKTSGRGNGL
jgi:aryl-alcohol dehydrogenase-like predicted oxidoreductase